MNWSSKLKKQWQKIREVFHRETDKTLALGSTFWRQTERERQPYQREQVMKEALEAWQVNPLARRIVELTTQYVVGAGVQVECEHVESQKFLRACWHHHLNHLGTRLMEWCDELTRSGNLFILLSTDASGMSYFRAVPATAIERIEHQENDLEQALKFYPKPTLDDPDPAPWTAYNVQQDHRDVEGSFQTVMLHYAINRPVGTQWGESDLGPILRWIARYANWLEDRARLNRYRNAFLYVVRGRYLSESARSARQRILNTQPPTPGSILVTDESESWEIISPQLASQDASLDGLALKKMIAIGAGVPLHFLAEPESATRTTAEASGGPTFQHYQQRQRFFLWMVKDVMTVALHRRAMVARGSVDVDAPVFVRGADISARDNLSLSQAAQNAAASFLELHEQGLIDDRELLRMVYRFAGEAGPVEKKGETHGRCTLFEGIP